MLNPGYRLGEALIASGQISEEDLNRALSQQKQTGEKLGETLVNLGILSQSTLVKTLASKLGVPGTYLRHGLIDPAVARLIDRDEAERLKVLPLFKVRGRLIVAMAEPQNLPTIDRLAAVTGCVQGGIQALSRSYYGRLIPADRAGTFYGFYNMMGKFAAVLGPLLMGLTSFITGDPRKSILSIVVLFVAGGAMLALAARTAERSLAAQTSS